MLTRGGVPRALAVLARALLAAALLTPAGCAAWPRSWGRRPCCADAKPVVRTFPVWWHLFDVTVVAPIEDAFHLVRVGRKLFGIPMRSFNLQHGVVKNSVFFEDRPIEALSVEDVRRGPTRPQDMAVPPFTITKLKAQGKTAGFFVADARGERYLFKLDAVDAPELLSGAEVVSSKLIGALGYHVPSYEIVRVRPEDLHLAPGVTVHGQDRAPQPFTTAELDRLLAGRVLDGTLRVAASKIVPGEILGPASFKQFRDCTEMRALKLAYGWLNNIDAKDHNTLLVWDGYTVTGYLFDFGTSLGADAEHGEPKGPCAGWTYIVDPGVAVKELLTLGFYRSGCNLRERPRDHNVGLFTSHFDPSRWKAYAPNLAFNAMNEEDGQWMAGRLARLSHAQIESAVAAGHYSDPEDAAYLVETLEARRRIITEHYEAEREEAP